MSALNLGPLNVLLKMQGASKFKKDAKEADGALLKMGRSVKQLAGAYIGLEAARQGFKLAKSAAELSDARRIFEMAGGDLDRLRESVRGTVSDFELIKKANLARTMGIPEKEFGKLARAAMAASKATGESVDFMLDSIVKGVSRGSPMILDNLGIVVSIDEATKNWAKANKRNAKELTKTEKAMAVLEATMKAVNPMIETAEKAGADSAESYQRFTTSVENLATAIGGSLNGAVGGLLPMLTEMADTFAEMFSGDLAKRFERMSAKAEKVARISGQLAKARNDLELARSAQNMGAFASFQAARPGLRGFSEDAAIGALEFRIGELQDQLKEATKEHKANRKAPEKTAKAVRKVYEGLTRGFFVSGPGSSQSRLSDELGAGAFLSGKREVSKSDYEKIVAAQLQGPMDAHVKAFQEAQDAAKELARELDDAARAAGAKSRRDNRQLQGLASGIAGGFGSTGVPMIDIASGMFRGFFDQFFGALIDAVGGAQGVAQYLAGGSRFSGAIGASTGGAAGGAGLATLGTMAFGGAAAMTGAGPLGFIAAATTAGPALVGLGAAAEFTRQGLMDAIQATESYQKTQRLLDMGFARLAHALEPVFEALMPVAWQLMQIAGVVGDVVGPAFAAVADLLGRVVYQSIQNFGLGILETIDAVLGLAILAGQSIGMDMTNQIAQRGLVQQGISNFGASFEDAFENAEFWLDFDDLMTEHNQLQAEANQNLREFNEELSNVPVGIKRLQYRSTTTDIDLSGLGFQAVVQPLWGS